jgi:hypothetical protein
MADVSVNLVESDSDDDGNDMETPSGKRVPNHLLTSTPYVPHFDIEEGMLGDTPDGKTFDNHEKYLHSSKKRQQSNIKVKHYNV